MDGLVRSSYTTVPTATTRRISDRARAFLDSYAEHDSTLMSIHAGLGAPLSMSPPSTNNVAEIALGEFVRGTFSSDEPRAWYTFTVTEAMAYRIDAISPDADPFVRLWSADNESTPLATDDDGGSNFNARVHIHLEPGVYYVSVEEVSNADGQFVLHVSPAD